jgi:hypothetical protein
MWAIMHKRVALLDAKVAALEEVRELMILSSKATHCELPNTGAAPKKDKLKIDTAVAQQTNCGSSVSVSTSRVSVGAKKASS